MDERHPNTAEEVVHPFKFKWIREKHKGKKLPAVMEKECIFCLCVNHAKILWT